VVVLWEGELATMGIPTRSPKNSLSKMRRVEGNIFQRVRSDGELGEKVIFEVGPDGKVTRMIRNSQYSIRIH
jgi:hypothetical protein